MREKSDKYEEVAEERRKEMEKLEKTGAELKEQLVQLQVSIWQSYFLILFHWFSVIIIIMIIISSSLGVVL